MSLKKERKAPIIAALIPWLAVGILCLLPHGALAEEPCQLTDAELDQVYAGNNDESFFGPGQWAVTVDAGEAATPFFMGDVSITDNAMENLSAMINVQAAGSVINVTLNVAIINVNNSNIGGDILTNISAAISNTVVLQ